jgi:hypothetical protein
MRTAGYVLCTLLAAAVGACAHRAPGPAETAQAKAAAPAPACPLTKLVGVRATVADIRDGVAITFTAPEGELDQLRNNVHAMADAEEKQHDAFASCPCAEHAAGAAEKMPMSPVEQAATQPQKVKADAKVDEISTGAVLKLTAKDHKDINALRAEVREDLRGLKKNCLARETGVTQPQGKAPSTKPSSHKP